MACEVSRFGSRSEGWRQDSRDLHGLGARSTALPNLGRPTIEEGKEPMILTDRFSDALTFVAGD